MRTALVWLALVSTLCACGQKGPLYLPDKNAAVVTRPAPAAAAAPAGTATAPAKKPGDEDTPPPQ
jgi:predicted small lipoprotein YifL